jgi:Mrp family chromosome partitioning ATPase
MIAINVYSPKGGVGTTTIASLLAHDYSKKHYIALVAKDTDSIAGTLGFQKLSGVPYKLNHGLTVSDSPIPDCDFTFIDSRAHMPAADLNILVLQNTYSSLRKVLDCKFDMAVVHMIPDYPLSWRDIVAVLGDDKFLQDMEWSKEAARKLDAGLCSSVLEREDYKRLISSVDSLITQDAPF